MNEAHEIDEATVRRVAEIMGIQSASSLALEEAARRRANGEQVAFFKNGSLIIVASIQGGSDAD